MDALVARQCEQALRRADEAALYRDPDRLEEQRIWNSYSGQVSAVAWAQGNQTDRWIARWRTLVSERVAAEEYGDSTASIDARLKAHVGIDFPQLPQAAWDTADVLPASERQVEYDRLTAKYDPRPGTPTTATPTTATPKRRRRT